VAASTLKFHYHLDILIKLPFEGENVEKMLKNSSSGVTVLIYEFLHKLKAK